MGHLGWVASMVSLGGIEDGSGVLDDCSGGLGSRTASFRSCTVVGPDWTVGHMGPVCCKPGVSLSLSGNVALHIHHHPLLGRADGTGHAQAMCEKHHREALQEQQPCAMPAPSCAHSSRWLMLSVKEKKRPEDLLSPKQEKHPADLTRIHTSPVLRNGITASTVTPPTRGHAVQYLSRPDPVEMVSLKDPPPCTAHSQVRPAEALCQTNICQTNICRPLEAEHVLLRQRDIQQI